MKKTTDMFIIEKYFTMRSQKTVFFDCSFGEQLKRIATRNQESILVTKNKIVKKVASILGVEVYDYSFILTEAKRYLAFGDACMQLARKNIPVYFYNRIGKKKDGFPYTESALKRMSNHDSFPKMYQDIEAYQQSLKELFGDKYSKEYVEQIGKIPQVIKKGNNYCHEDCKGKYVNVIDGKRKTCFQPESYTQTIHIYGRCGVFGYAVEDAETLPSQMQKYLIEKGIGKIRIVNHGLWGADDSMLDHNFFMDVKNMREGDIVVFYRFHFNKSILEFFGKAGLQYKEITEDWHKNEAAKWCFYDKPGHMNNIGYQIAAQLIVDDLSANKFGRREVDQSLESFFGGNLERYLSENRDSVLENGVEEYVKIILEEYPDTEGGMNGGIVMNCNPFTLGHRYLIEYAAQKVEWLYIFVVEEDKSFFKFVDRFQMVKEGTKDISNVIVVPSGQFIISSYTFPEYFMKDYVKERNFDVSGDVSIFCSLIAPKLNIKKRFVGEEPFDPVTNNYNQTMKRLLPEYDMELIEIPRKKIDDSRVISATQVRKLLHEKNYEMLKELVPQSTYEVLCNKYFGRKD